MFLFWKDIHEKPVNQKCTLTWALFHWGTAQGQAENSDSMVNTRGTDDSRSSKLVSTCILRSSFKKNLPQFEISIWQFFQNNWRYSQDGKKLIAFLERAR